MEELQDLVRIIAQKRLKKIDILNNPDMHKDGKSVLSLFYHALLSGKVKKESDAIKLLGYKENSIGYRSFKSRFKTKLYNSLFFIKLSNSGLSDYDKVAYECSRAQHLVRVMDLFWARNSSTRLCEIMLSKAEKYELSEFMVFYLKNLVQKAANSESKNAFNKYTAMLEFWWQRWLAEENAKLAYHKVQNMYAGTIMRQPNVGTFALDAADKIATEIPINDSYILRLHLFRLQGLGNYIVGNYKLSNKAWKALENFLMSNPKFCSNARLGESALQQMLNYLHLKQYNSGIECSNRCEKYFMQGSLNRTIFKEYYFLLLMHNKSYMDANIVWATANKDFNIKEISDFHKSKWKLFDAYLYLILGKGYASDYSEGFKISKFQNEINSLSKDKKGMNMPILIVTICIHLMECNYSELLKSMQSLKLYKSRYLSKSSSRRIQILVNMLLIMEKCDYKLERVKKYTSEWYNKLITTPYDHSGSLEGLEVIPAERLWEFAIGYMKIMMGKGDIRSS